MVQVKDLVAGDYIRSYQICGDEKWHKVHKVDDKGDGTFYLAIENYGHGFYPANMKVERIYR